MKTSKLNFLLNENLKIDTFTKNFESVSYWSNGRLLLSKKFFIEEIEYLINMAKIKKIKICEKTDEEMELSFKYAENIIFEETNLLWSCNEKLHKIFLAEDVMFSYRKEYIDALESINQIHYEVLIYGTEKYLLTNSDRSFILMNVNTNLNYRVSKKVVL